VRVGQGFAGTDYGLVLLPRINQEVLIAYLGGDPDQPIIIGRVHNALSQTPLKLPEEKTRSIWRSRSSPGGEGYNEIVMEDLAGAEVLSLRAQRDHKAVTLRDSDTTVGGDRSLQVDGSQSVVVGKQQTLKISGLQHVTVGETTLVESKKSYTVATDDNLVLDAAKDAFQFTSGTHTIEARNGVVRIGDALDIEVEGALTLRGRTITLKAGGSAIEITDGGIKIESDGPVEVNGAIIKLNC
jgi:type VI secretion system secreted protein VgrG